MRLGLVLSGGGANAAFEVGVVAALADAGLVPHVLSGTSAGALNAAGLAAGFDAARLERLWLSVRDRDVYRLRGDLWRLLDVAGFAVDGNIAERVLTAIRWTWLWETAPLRETLVRAFDGETIPVAGDTVLAVSAVDVTSGGLVRFTSTDPPPHRHDDRFRTVAFTVDHLLASAAIPLLFQPGTVAGVPYWDGGIVANTPIAPAMAYEPDAVVVVMTSPSPPRAAAPANLAEAFGRLLQVVGRFALEADFRHAETVNRLAAVAPAADERRVVELLVVEPESDLGDPLHFDPAHAARLIAAGRQAGEKAIGRWLEEGRLASQR